uniref:Uncharacterized protein n=1 Tax=Arundo donax TaxID=35708 RepID=A0A0A9H6T1_ARUDO
MFSGKEYSMAYLD